MSGLVFWVFGLVFWVSGLVFWVAGLVFWVSGLVFWVSVYLQDVTMARALPSPNKAPAEFP